MNLILIKIKTIFKLGLSNFFKVLIYRILVRSKIFIIKSPIKKIYWPNLAYGFNSKKFISTIWSNEAKNLCIIEAEKIITGNIKLFGSNEYNLGSPPKWKFNFIEESCFPSHETHWSNINLYSNSDIKYGWEISRWEWSTKLARAFLYSGEKKYLDTLNLWASDWCKNNDINGGINWICGQEIAIRLINALSSWNLIDNHNNIPRGNLERINFVELHLKRIYETRFYAEAQKNNHWIIESAALFIGGNWLKKVSNKKNIEHHKYAKNGLKGINKSLEELILDDGTFSQQSLNYHRLLLDILSILYLWNKNLDLDLLSPKFLHKCKLATNWICNFVDPISGKASILGHNDGAHCFQLHNLDYLDYRPTLQLASILFKSKKKYNSGIWDEPLFWHNLEIAKDFDENDKTSSKKNNRVNYLSKGGFIRFEINRESWGYLRLPKYHFRPAHTDPLHLDIWHKGQNILVDGGTFSYNSLEDKILYYSGVESHNTIQFNNKQPMIKLGRFLWGNWLTLEKEPTIRNLNENLYISASYKCKFGRHQRIIEANNATKIITIIDKVSSFNKASLRWRLGEKNFKKVKNNVSCKLFNLSVFSDKPLSQIKIKEGYISKYYSEEKPIKILEIHTNNSPTEIKTILKLH